MQQFAEESHRHGLMCSKVFSAWRKAAAGALILASCIASFSLGVPSAIAQSKSSQVGDSVGTQSVGTQPASATKKQVVQPLTPGLELWNAAKAHDEASVRKLLDEMFDQSRLPAGAELAASKAQLDNAIDKREQTRSEKIAEVSAKLDEDMKDKGNPKSISEALKHANELFMLVHDKAAFVAEPRTKELLELGEKEAHAAEARQDWFTANELFYRMYVLLSDQNENEFKSDFERLNLRLAMIRMYTPEAFWKLRNDERLKEKKSPLPPYNGLGEDYHDRLKGVDKAVVMQAILSAGKLHINSQSVVAKTGKKINSKDIVTPRGLLETGLGSLRTMMTTTDLQAAFPALGDAEKVNRMVDFLDAQLQRLAAIELTASNTRSTLSDILDDAIEMNHKTVNIPDEVLLHEFGNGAMSHLDDFSAIIWPDEVARFDRMTTGKFVGVGVQIQLDDESQLIKVVTPLEGTPAQRAGIRAGDLIKKINGQSAVGISLNQAVDLITGPRNTQVTVAVERDGQEIEFSLTRAVIEQPSVKGWKRIGLKESDWDWFIDPAAKIGYVRMSTGFSDGTTQELRSAILAMKQSGLNGLVFDLRFNPGGLLTEGIGVANVFIDEGPIVSAGGQVNRAQRDDALLNKLPVVVLINQGSASASEIVSGAIRQYADWGDIDAIIIGERSFGKGSVQVVLPLRSDGKAKMRLTTQYYLLPDGSIIHKRPGLPNWGVDPHLSVDMLPQQVSDALKLRQDADVLPIDEHGNIVESKDPRPDPEKLLTDGMDPQLAWGLTLLQARVADSAVSNQAARTEKQTQ